MTDLISISELNTLKSENLELKSRLAKLENKLNPPPPQPIEPAVTVRQPPATSSFIMPDAGDLQKLIRLVALRYPFLIPQDYPAEGVRDFLGVSFGLVPWLGSPNPTKNITSLIGRINAKPG
jgi:hypothetical protein